ncbi:unnamed protein product [Caenorhabditis bovis]|uniref:ERCC1-like central domain-containing protein n=1 Tax=Caenorhabditis bovis TaxID=2654633 RepID=A0A8S1FC24_9PELO|nr:unnamed protein product [Caenorhabditis bovis]
MENAPVGTISEMIRHIRFGQKKVMQEGKEPNEKGTKPPCMIGSDSIPTGAVIGSASSGIGGALLVNRRRQEGNPVLKYVRNVRYEWGDIAPDFECGSTFAVVYLSFKYHKMHPNYVYTRLSARGENNYKHKVLLAYCNVEEPRHVQRELNMMCYRQGWTLVICYSVEEAAEYIENFKLSQSKDVTFKKPGAENDGNERAQLHEIAVGILTAARGITKTDAQRLLFNFGTLENIGKADEAKLALSPGLGPIKAKNLYSFLHTPFAT